MTDHDLFLLPKEALIERIEVERLKLRDAQDNFELRLNVEKQKATKAKRALELCRQSNKRLTAEITQLRGWENRLGGLLYDMGLIGKRAETASARFKKARSRAKTSPPPSSDSPGGVLPTHGREDGVCG